MDTKNLILVVCDPLIDYYEDLNYQLLGKARALAKENGAKVLCIYWGKDKEYAEALQCYGAGKVILCDYEDDDYTVLSEIVRHIITNYMPSLVLFTGTDLGKATAATVATMVGAGLVADCIEIKPQGHKKYIFSRAALSSSVIANIVCNEGEIQMGTVKPNIFIKYVEKGPEAEKNLTEYHNSFPGRFEDYIQAIKLQENTYVEPCNLEKSKIIFAVGRGVSDEDLKVIHELALEYGADIGGTRIMVEKGKITKSRQIGQSGTNVAPDLYVAFGISGANQHITGIQNAKNIFAINNDEKATIFEYSDYAMISDVHEVIKKLRMI